MKTTILRFFALLPVAVLAGAASAEETKTEPAPQSTAAAANPHSSPPFLAVVNDTVISSAEFDAAASEAARQKFYHGTPPEGAIDKLLREVANRMIDRVLLLAEIERQGLKPDARAVEDKLATYEKRYASSPRWQQERENILPKLRERLEQDDMLATLEAKVRDVPPPNEKTVRAYYEANPDKFTEPEKMRVSVILVKVDPSSPTAAWQAAETKVGALRMQILEGGADFAALAREHSEEESAEKGGDLGYLHRGMLPEGIQQKIDGMKPGDLSEPTRVLQGYVLFRYEARQEPKHHDFATVRARASDLVVRDQSEEAWSKFVAQLRQNARIELNTQRYAALGQPNPPAK